MLARQVVKRQGVLRAATVHFFSTDNSKSEWGIKYNDDCLKFEKEWKKIADKIEGQ